MDGAVRLSSGEVSRWPPLRACTTPAGLDAQAARRGGDFGQEGRTHPEVSYLTRKTSQRRVAAGRVTRLVVTRSQSQSGC